MNFQPHQLVIPNCGPLAGRKCTIKRIEGETAHIEHNIIGPAKVPLGALTPVIPSGPYEKYRIRQNTVKDLDGFPRYSIKATVGGVESEIITEALSEDLDAELNAWIEAREEERFAIYK